MADTALCFVTDGQPARGREVGRFRDVEAMVKACMEGRWESDDYLAWVLYDGVVLDPCLSDLSG